MGDPIEVKAILEKKVWVDGDIDGSKSVYFQYEGKEPVKFCTFFYAWPYTDNASVLSAANAAALRIGASEVDLCTN